MYHKMYYALGHPHRSPTMASMPDCNPPRVQHLRPIPLLPLTTSQPHLVFEAPDRVQMLSRSLKRLAARRH